MNLRTFALLLPALHLCAPPALTSPNSSPPLTLSVTPQYAFPEDTIWVEVTVSNDLSGDNGFSQISLQIRYKPELGEVYGIDETTKLLSPVFPQGLINEKHLPGEIRLLIVDARQNRTGGQLIALPFRVSDTAPPGSYSFALNEVEMTDNLNRAVKVHLQDGTLTLLPLTGVGDVNGDDAMDLKDAFTAFCVQKGFGKIHPKELRASDVWPSLGQNGLRVGDRSVSMEDVNWILRRLFESVDH